MCAFSIEMFGNNFAEYANRRQFDGHLNDQIGAGSGKASDFGKIFVSNSALSI